MARQNSIGAVIISTIFLVYCLSVCVEEVWNLHEGRLELLIQGGVSRGNK